MAGLLLSPSSIKCCFKFSPFSSANSKYWINAYNDLANQSEREKISRAQIVIPNGPRLGGKVIEVDGLHKAMGDKLLIENLEFSLPPGGIVGVIGPNGYATVVRTSLINSRSSNIY